MQELDSFARWLVEDPTAAPLIAGAVVALVVQAIKRLWPGVKGATRWRNLAIAAATSLLVTWARQQLSGQHEAIAQFAVSALVTWASAALTHNVVLKRENNGTEGAEPGTSKGGA